MCREGIDFFFNTKNATQAKPMQRQASTSSLAPERVVKRYPLRSDSPVPSVDDRLKELAVAARISQERVDVIERALAAMPPALPPRWHLCVGSMSKVRRFFLLKRKQNRG